MDIRNTTPIEHAAGRRLRYHGLAVAVTLAVLVFAAAGMTVALWVASFFFCASQHINPLHAGFHAWPDAALAWYDGRSPKEGRRLAGSALFGLLLAFGAPAFALYTFLERSGHRHLYGNARFADDAEIRRAGLL